MSVVIVGVIRRKPVLTHASIVCEGMLASVNSVNSPSFPCALVLTALGAHAAGFAAARRCLRFLVCGKQLSTVTGSNQLKAVPLKAVPREKRLTAYVGRLAKDTTADKLTAFL